MEYKKWYQKIFTLWNFIILFGTIGFIMLVLYFWKFNEGLSDDYEKWGSFGDYFGSITGLLAFLGVLYSLLEAKKETKETKDKAAIAEVEAKSREEKVLENSIKREERDLFFKLIELHKEKSKSIHYKFESFNYSGLDAFVKYTDILNSFIVYYSIYDCIVKMDTTLYNSLKINNNNFSVENIIINKCKKIYKENIEINNFYLVDTDADKFNKIQEYLKSNYQSDNFYSKFNSNLVYIKYDFYSYLNIDFYYDDIYKAIQLAGNYINASYGEYIGQYIRNLYYILDTIDNFEFDKIKYFKMFRAQLSRKETFFCLFMALSNKSSRRFVELLDKNKILDNIYYKDIVFKREEYQWQDEEQGFVIGMFRQYYKNNPEWFYLAANI